MVEATGPSPAESSSMVVVAARSPNVKQDLAAQAWRPLARFFFDTVRHRQRVLVREGLTPNDVRALMALDTGRGRRWECWPTHGPATPPTPPSSSTDSRSGVSRSVVRCRGWPLKLVVLTERRDEVSGACSRTSSSLLPSCSSLKRPTSRRCVTPPPGSRLTTTGPSEPRPPRRAPVAGDVDSGALRAEIAAGCAPS